jgi:hypothetical protein
VFWEAPCLRSCSSRDCMTSRGESIPKQVKGENLVLYSAPSIWFLVSYSYLISISSE